MSRAISPVAFLTLLFALAPVHADDHGGGADRWSQGGGDSWHLGKGGRGCHEDCPVVSAPELGASSAGAALVLLAGGLFIVRGRRTVRKD